MTRRLALFVLFASATLILTAAPTRAQAQASLTKAKELYASANYDEALTMLNTLVAGSISGEGLATGASDDAAAVAMYRVLCLVAVGRATEVDAAIERLVSQHPLYRPPSDELSPRMRTAISTARLRLLPAMVQRRYAEAKNAYDSGDYANAGAGFKWVLSALADPDISYLAGQSPLSDLKVLATGFVDLSAKALAPPPPAPAAAPPSPAAATPVVTRDLKRVFSPEDSDVVAPVTIKQEMPRFNVVLKVPASGILEVVIDVAGGVESARMVQSVHPQYDQLILANARKWLYQPAKLDGTPVRYLKRIQISLAVSDPNLRR